MDVLVAVPMLLGILGGGVLSVPGRGTTANVVGIILALGGIIWTIKAHRALRELDDIARLHEDRPDGKITIGGGP